MASLKIEKKEDKARQIFRKANSLYCKQHFYKQHQAEIGKVSSKS